MPASNACFNIGRACSSGSVQVIPSIVGLLNDIAPKMILETLSPDLPSLEIVGVSLFLCFTATMP